MNLPSICETNHFEIENKCNLVRSSFTLELGTGFLRIFNHDRIVFRVWFWIRMHYLCLKLNKLMNINETSLWVDFWILEQIFEKIHRKLFLTFFSSFFSNEKSTFLIDLETLFCAKTNFFYLNHLFLYCYLRGHSNLFRVLGGQTNACCSYIFLSLHFVMQVWKSFLACALFECPYNTLNKFLFETFSTTTFVSCMMLMYKVLK